MNRKQFIESQGATCNNWNWSWSFVNKEERFIIFGFWSHQSNDDEGFVLSKDWIRSAFGKKTLASINL